MTTCPEIYTVRVHPVSEMVRVMPTETEVTEAKTASPIIAPQQETIVLTACMRSKDVREDVLPMLIEDDFVKSDHRTLFRAIRAMHEADYPIDEVSLLDYLKSSRMLDAAGGEKAVLRMFESDMPLLSWQTAYDRLIDASRRRSLVMAMNEIEAKAYGTPPDMKAFVSKIENSVAQVTERRDMRPYRHISSFLGAAVDEVGEISRRLKVLAKELGVPVVTLAQLSRQAEFHPGAPRLSDLRESGSIEQDADTVLFLSRDPNETGDEKSGARQVILSIAKNRSGPTGDIDMLFVPTSTKFYEVGPRKENCDD